MALRRSAGPRMSGVNRRRIKAPDRTLSGPFVAAECEWFLEDRASFSAIAWSDSRARHGFRSRGRHCHHGIELPGVPFRCRLDLHVRLVASTSNAQRVPDRGQIIATGWDNPSPSQFRQHLAEFEKWPFQGTVIRPVRKLAEGREVGLPRRFSAVSGHGPRLEASIADLKGARPSKAAGNLSDDHRQPGERRLLRRRRLGRDRLTLAVARSRRASGRSEGAALR